MSTFNQNSKNTAAPKHDFRRKVPLFALGQVVATPAVLEHLDKHGINAQDYLDRHVCGDWGNVPPDDVDANQYALAHGLRVLSSYDISGARIWIITESDRSYSTLLFPSEY